ncbi:MAG: hypothetical protein QN122_13515 [Armatimonadota bacterium]|nr:hypothetical protein [Armatimonadota bacterium]
MPFYVFRLDVSPLTPATNPARRTLLLEPGTLFRTYVQFPRGCGGLVHAQILRGGTVIYPAPPDVTLASDGYVIAIEDEYPIPQAEEWSLIAWSEDDTYPHRIEAWLNVRAPRGRAIVDAARALFEALRAPPSAATSPPQEA